MLQHRLIVSVVAAFSCSVGADVVFVDAANCPGPGNGSEADPYCSIQTAIDAAVDLDEIVVAPGTYFETINFLGKAITLRSSDGAETTSIDAGFSGTVVTCTSGEGPDTLLDGFTITGGSGVVGGGMFNAGASPTVRECVFTGNHAQFLGGAMFNDLGSTTVTDCLFESNSSDLDAGGIFNGRGSPLFLRCRFLGNAAGCFGGAILNANSDATLINCLLADNTAECLGGAITHAANNGILTAINCTITGNTAGDAGGGIHNFEDSLLLVHNCILWANADAGGMDSSAQIDGAAGITVSFSDVQGGFPGEANIDADPLFVDPDNGDFRLQAGSPCIDAGDNASMPNGVLRDLDGNPRFIDSTFVGTMATVDMGAYEYQRSVGGGRAIGDGPWQRDMLTLLGWNALPGLD